MTSAARSRAPLRSTTSCGRPSITSRRRCSAIPSYCCRAAATGSRSHPDTRLKTRCRRPPGAPRTGLGSTAKRPAGARARCRLRNGCSFPSRPARGLLGLLGVSFENPKRELTPEQRHLLEALVDQVAVAIERTNLVTDIEEARLLTETERLRSALLSSVSHDLRTPLVSIIGSATGLASCDGALSQCRPRAAGADHPRGERAA